MERAHGGAYSVPSCNIDRRPRLLIYSYSVDFSSSSLNPYLLGNTQDPVVLRVLRCMHNTAAIHVRLAAPCLRKLDLAYTISSRLSAWQVWKGVLPCKRKSMASGCLDLLTVIMFVLCRYPLRTPQPSLVTLAEPCSPPSHMQQPIFTCNYESEGKCKVRLLHIPKLCKMSVAIEYAT
jgi:hypothetical protein